jgi:hypothetical protein
VRENGNALEAYHFGFCGILQTKVDFVQMRLSRATPRTLFPSGIFEKVVLVFLEFKKTIGICPPDR